MTLTFIQGHRITGKIELINHSVIKLHEVTQMFAIVDCVREMTSEKSFKYGKYGLFEHLLFLSVILSCHVAEAV